MAAECIAAEDPTALTRAADALRGGKVVGIPTETVYGLAVIPASGPLERLIAAKRRSADRAIALLVDSLDQVRGLARMTADADLLAARFWPGPLTLVLAQLADRPLPALLTGGRPTIGVRLPDHPVPRQLCRMLGPLAASSANVSGQPDATTAGQLIASLGELVELVVDDGPVRGGVPSTVVECLDDAPPRILRAGALSEQEILAAAATLDGQP